LSKYDSIAPASVSVGCYTAAVVAGIRDYTDEMDLFDFGCPYMRKVRLSELDECLDEQSDFDAFVARTKGLDRLLVVDDRQIEHPIMAEYDKLTKSRYVAALKDAGIRFEFVRCLSP